MVFMNIFLSTSWVLSAGDVWVATIPACTTSGRTVSGLRIMADGTDENGDAVTGFVLGVADFAVATFDIAPAPGATSYALRYFDNVPNPPPSERLRNAYPCLPLPSSSASLTDGRNSFSASGQPNSGAPACSQKPPAQELRSPLSAENSAARSGSLSKNIFSGRRHRNGHHVSTER